MRAGPAEKDRSGMQNRRLKFRGRATTPGAIAEGDRYLAYTLFSGFSSISNIKSRQEERDFFRLHFDALVFKIYYAFCLCNLKNIYILFI